MEQNLEPKNKYDYLAHIMLGLTFAVITIPISIWVILALGNKVQVNTRDISTVFSPMLLVLPLSMLGTHFAAKANQTPLAQRLKKEKEDNPHA